MKIGIATVIGMSMVLVGVYLFGSGETTIDILLSTLLILAGIYMLAYIYIKKYQERHQTQHYEEMAESMAQADIEANERLLASQVEDDIYCRECGASMAPKTNFCPECGGKMPLDACPECGKAIENNTKFCDDCGTKTDMEHD